MCWHAKAAQVGGGRRTSECNSQRRALWHVSNATRRFMQSPESCAFRIDSATHGFVQQDL